ncbi:type VII secretion protein EccC [Corynebacterium timonense]|uniref:type VII secretion protein EccC n=1 Tax=Corynebacterium timonense TaxID=441500 RepID=UPI00030C313F|nr:type VII secretion protein EccC [Corynebacterium timonense]
MLGLDHNAVLVPLSPQAAEPAPALPTGALTAEGVPAAQKATPPPLVKILMPIVVLAAVGAMVAIMALSGRGVSPMMMLFPLMMLVGLLMMVAPPDKTSNIDETRRVYLRHLDALAARARANAVKQRAHALHFHPDPALLLAATPTWRVWERGADSPRAGEVRIGLGDSALCTPIDVADPGSPEDLDPVCAVSLRRTVAAVGTVPGMPIVVQLAAFPTLTLAGPTALGVARALLAQLAFFHGPEAVGVVNRHADPSLEWTKWLPHTAAPERAWLTVVLADAASAHAALADPAASCVIVIDDDPDYVVDEDAFNLVCGEDIRARTEAGEELLGTPDALGAAEALLIARHLAFYRRPAEGSATASSGLLDMLGIADVDQLDAHTMWGGRAGTRQHLTVPFGVSPDGQPVYLDLKEAAHGGMGPHGLCIGATGSGKSEFLRTLVVALAATHSPEELNLVLVDFKGGATFLGCEALPHTSAVITNLAEESFLVERMHDAISGELNRRQELLRAAGNVSNITDYAAARAHDPTLEALPALLIVVDEFSELLSQHPHFADLFVAVGRLGRSLGVHLLLASQRLEEGRLRGLDSHLSYRIGLKTFSSAESRQVLGVPDAHELPAEPGSGFLSTGPGELTRFRAAYVSGPVTRHVEHQVPGEGPRVQLFDGWSDPSHTAPETHQVVDESTTVLSAVVDAAARTARERGLRAHTVWLPPLPASIELAAVCEEAGFLRAVIGLTDEPYKQRQEHFVVDLSAAGGHLAIVGGPQTGKSMALTTLVASLAATHTTEQVAVYAIDAGAGRLEGLEVLPHVAGVAPRENEEKVRRVVAEVAGFIDDPATLGGRHAILIVDGWHAVAGTESPLADLRDELTRIAADGPAAGVHLVLTAQRWSAVRATVRDLIGTRVELRLTEAHDSLLDRKAQASLPASPGRGLSPEGTPMLIAATYPQDLAHIAARAAGQTPVPRLKVLPAHVSVHPLLDATPNALPLGVGGPRLEPLACASGHLLAFGTGGSGKSTLLASAIEVVARWPREEARLVIVDPRRTHLGRAPDEMVAAYAATSSAAAEALAAAATTLSQRLPGADVTAEQLAARSWWQGPDIWVVIDDLDLVADEVLRPLIPLLPHARDVGLHLVVARKFGGVARALYGGFLGAAKDLAPDVMLFDATRDEGTIFGVRPSAHKPGRATLVRGSDVVGTVQVAAPYGEGGTL